MSREPPRQSTSSSSREGAADQTEGTHGDTNVPSAPYPPFPATHLSPVRPSNLTASSPFTAAGMNLSMNASAAFARSTFGGTSAATAFYRDHSAGFGSGAAGDSVSGASTATTVGESSSLDRRGRMSTSSMPTLDDPSLLRKGAGNAVANRAFQQQQQMQVVSPKVQFCHWNVLATINCVQDVPMDASGPFVSPSNKAAPGIVGTTSSRPGTRKAGPVLLELLRIQFPRHRSSGDDDEHEASLFSTNTMVQSRGNPSLGTSVASTCLDVAPQLSSRHLSGVDATAATMSSSSSSNIYLSPCVTGLTTGAVCIHTFSPQVSLNETAAATTTTASSTATGDGVLMIPSIEYYHTTRNHRPATAVAWRPTYRHVAVGLTGTTTGGVGGSGDHHHRLHHHLAASAASIGGTSRRAQGTGSGTPSTTVGRGGMGSAADRDFCCFVYDVEHQSGSGSSTAPTARRTKPAPIFKLSHQTGVASLAWLLDGGQTLAVGGQLRGQLQIYDLRSSGTNMNPPITAYAHSYGIAGIEADPHHPWQFVSFCQTANEPVKVWDVRRMDMNLTEIKVASSSTKGQPSGGDSNALDAGSTVISAAKWSHLDPGMLFFALGDSIVEYDASTGSRPIQVNAVHSQRPILDFALYPYPEHQDIADTKEGSNKRVIAELFRNRIAIIDDDRTFKDMARRAIAPLAVSKRDGRLLHGLGRTLWMHGTDEGPTAMESHELRPDEDISATMMRRARCSLPFKYSMDTISNLQLLGQEITDMTTRTRTDVDDSGRSSNTDGPSVIRDALLRLWFWIQRVEEIIGEDDTGLENEYRWTSKGLVGTGAWRLLQMSGAGESEMQVFSEELSCTVYDSTDRRAALTSCGWAGRFELYDVLSQCEDLGDYERAAAIAVWHGDIGAGIESLQRGAGFIRSQVSSERSSKTSHITTEYAETLELAAISIAGFRGNDRESAQSTVWQKVCTGLLQRQILTGERINPTRTAYIRCAIGFLLSVGRDNHYQEILGDSNIALCDRVAFACRFLERSELKKFLERYIEDGKVSGNVEALTITGIDKDGIKILQSYVDRYADVQTATLVTSRVIFPPDWTEERRICAEWLGAYRSLLNTWEMWQSRAMFDVERANLLRKVKARQMAIGSGAARRSVAGRRGGPRAPDPDIFAAIPSQLDARCNYCNAPLGLRNQDSTSNHWLAKLKPILSCCPQCRKPLPRCAICMLSLGTLNPYMELTKDRTRSGRSTPQLPLSDDSSSLGNLPFAEWFTWCMRCKHGGHAHHMVGWFSKHAVCPVSGCDCRCQFDGMPKLKRPALSNLQTEITAPKTEL